ncbi:MAG: hypothetical protein AAGI01_11165 [Myxococcota bacterium]
MRTIVCHFMDAAELQRHIFYGRTMMPEAIAFLGAKNAEPGECVKLVVVVESLRERIGVKVQVRPRPTTRDVEPFHVHVGEVAGEDQVWLRMFASKIRMMGRVVGSAWSA